MYSTLLREVREVREVRVEELSGSLAPEKGFTLKMDTRAWMTSNTWIAVLYSS